MEAIECIKCLILFCEVQTLEQLTEELEGMEIDAKIESKSVVLDLEKFSWDSLQR